jgi:ribosomal protein L11 methyltransferase
MDCFCFHIKDSVTMDDAWQELEFAGFPLLYSSEELGGQKEIYGYLPSSLSLETVPKTLQSITSISSTKLQIDWTEQWALHSPEFQDGFVQVDLQGLGVKKILQLQPGPGFGDLSHPTTHLVMKLMQHRLRGRHIIDIGTGSGILALSAAAMGAQSVIAIDIDPEALAHAKKNALLNQMSDKIHFCFPGEFSLREEAKSAVVLMNMIRSEQKQAWESLPTLHKLPGESIVSGVLSKEKGNYIKQAKGWGWKLKEEISEKEWVAFCFERS